ncbi:MAG: alkaline phosphatase family protein [Rhizonema sp. NSF051]|nr:alkaline phosphatase family protein [Rhizonema sp. NSF051]
MFNRSKWAIALTLLCSASAILAIASQSTSAANRVRSRYQHVLILSIDGLHGADIADAALQSNLPNIISLEKTGVTYTNAFTSEPSDSFPGTLSYLTGASPKTTGVYYDDSYDRQLTFPGGSASDPRGTEVVLDESIDKDSSLLNGGGDYGVGSIDPKKLPLACTNTDCTPVYPHNFVKVNTIFDVAKGAGLYTAFSDKHSGAYDIANGPNGNAVDDYYSPEIAALVAIENGVLVDKSTAQNKSALTFNGVTSDYKLTEAYDDLKVTAIVNEINGKNSLGTQDAPVPAIFAMNFQAVSVAQKAQVGGIDFANGTETPSSEFTDALSHTDASVGKIVNALKQKNLLNSTLVIVTAKHGQNPRLGSSTLVQDSIIPNALKVEAGVEVAQATQDDVSLLWLKDQEQTKAAVRALEKLKANSQTCGGTVQDNCNPGIEEIFSGSKLRQAGFGNPARDTRTPDIIVKLKPGFILVGNVASKVKRAEHGGLNEDDTHVGLIVNSDALPDNLKGSVQDDKVDTTQIAVTTLDALGLNPAYLQGAKIQKTQVLPGLDIPSRF